MVIICYCQYTNHDYSKVLRRLKLVRLQNILSQRSFYRICYGFPKLLNTGINFILINSKSDILIIYSLYSLNYLHIDRYRVIIVMIIIIIIIECNLVRQNWEANQREREKEK